MILDHLQSFQMKNFYLLIDNFFLSDLDLQDINHVSAVSILNIYLK